MPRPNYSQRSFTTPAASRTSMPSGSMHRHRPRRALADLVAAFFGEPLRGAPRDDQDAAVGQEQQVIAVLQDRRVVAVAARGRPFQPAI